jgi:two-component system LytT family sensor kinase
MEAEEPELSRPRVAPSTVLASIAGLWLCYFVLTTIRAEILDLGYTYELLWRRALLTLIGVALTLAMWTILRLFDTRPLWMKITVALVVAVPVSVAIAQANRMIFAGVEQRIMARMCKNEGLCLRRDESGNILVDVPLPRLGIDPAVLQSGGKVPASVTITSQSASENRVQEITEIALGRYFLLLAWCALYLALVAAEQARSAERREGAFRRAAKAAELRSLRYQVNPHFLFNTLNSLSALVLTGRTQQAETMIQTISTFYRRSLADDPTMDVPLAEEFDLQRLYLDIEAARFPERLVAVFDLPPELADAEVPGMILQPLVENSVKHALAPSSGKVTITLSAREEYGRLVIAVTDDGKHRASSSAERPGYGIGLANVRERLEARFGDQASIVSGFTGTGYSSQIRIPLLRDE